MISPNQVQIIADLICRGCEPPRSALLADTEPSVERDEHVFSRRFISIHDQILRAIRDLAQAVNSHSIDGEPERIDRVRIDKICAAEIGRAPRLNSSHIPLSRMP